jgi:hypothetical protein
MNMTECPRLRQSPTLLMESNTSISQKLAYVGTVIERDFSTTNHLIAFHLIPGFSS